MPAFLITDLSWQGSLEKEMFRVLASVIQEGSWYGDWAPIHCIHYTIKKESWQRMRLLCFPWPRFLTFLTPALIKVSPLAFLVLCPVEDFSTLLVFWVGRYMWQEFFPMPRKTFSVNKCFSNKYLIFNIFSCGHTSALF